MEITKREALRGAAWASAALVVGLPGQAAEKSPAAGRAAPGPRSPGSHAPRPLPCDPRKLSGLSEKLIRSHHENNYGGAVHNLNAVERELASLPADAPGYRVAGLRGRELLFRNSMALHELYFANLGGDGEPAGRVAGALDAAFGGRAAFEARFRATAHSLGGGSGWALLSYDLHDQGLRIQWAGDHSQALVDAEPLLVLDMYEHSYHMDYGTAAKRYVEAFMKNVDWAVVERRYASALRVSALRIG